MNRRLVEFHGCLVPVRSLYQLANDHHDTGAAYLQETYEFVGGRFIAARVPPETVRAQDPVIPIPGRHLLRRADQGDPQ